MESYSFAQDPAQVVLRDLKTGVGRERTELAGVIARIAEADVRKLYAPEGHASMYKYCMKELGYTKQAALKRIYVARKARRFPAIFPALADGRLFLGAVVMLGPHLNEDTADDLLAGAYGKSKFEIQRLLAARNPRPDVPARVEAISPPTEPTLAPSAEVSPGSMELPALSFSPGRTDRPNVSPLSAERYALQLTMDQEMFDDLESLYELLGHQVRAGDVTEVVRRSFKALLAKLEKSKYAATDKPRSRQGSREPRGRSIPAHVRRAVRQRDGGRCTFVAEKGNRCSERSRLEFDHVVPVARGGKSTADNLRLRCRTHNQYEAERTFGPKFMDGKREEAREQAAARRARAAEEERKQAALREQTEDLISGLRRLGYGASDARRAAEFSRTNSGASLEQRMRRALTYFAPRGHREDRPAPAH